MSTVLDIGSCNLVILLCCVLGFIYAIFNAWLLSRVQVKASLNPNVQDQSTNIPLILEVASHIQQGADTFLFQEYKIIAVFILLLAALIFVSVETTLGHAWVTVSYLTGALTSLVSGFVGMRVAVFSNYRCAIKCQTSMTGGFQVAYRAGCVLGFTLASAGVLCLTVLIAVYNNWYLQDYEDLSSMYVKIAGYGLGGSTMALFGRVGGGIYTKCADVGADLVGKVEENMDEDSPNNPATIADNVGDNVGDIAGMGSDLFGSFAEATCASLVVASTSQSFQFHPQALYYPIMVSALSIVACLLITLVATFASKCEGFDQVQNVLKKQLIYSTLLLVPTLYLAAELTLPWKLTGLAQDRIRHPYHAWLCTVMGLVSGLTVGIFTEYYTSHSYGPTRELARSCETGAATNIIYGIALGNLSCVVPVFCLSVTAFVTFLLLGMFGISLGALGILSNLSLGLAIDAYGPVSDNAGGIAEMCEMGEETRKRTDALDAAGNTTAAIGKGFAIGSACLVALALYGAFITRASNPMNPFPMTSVNVINPLIFAGLLIGAMLPYWFSALCMKAVGAAANEMVKEIRRQLQENPGIRDGTVKPDHQACIAISTDASLKRMVAPGALVLMTPFITGVFFGPKAVAGLLPGAIISGVAMATSSANSGGAWDNAKKYVESGQLAIKGVIKAKGTQEHKAAVVGDTVGDPLKDTSGPALNILIKLMAIFSLVFCGFFEKTGFLEAYMYPNRVTA